MAKTALPLLLIFLLPAAAGLSFNVDLEVLTDHSVKDLQYDNRVEAVQNVNASISNVGSIGCTYRLKTDYSYANESFTSYSSPSPLWQGDSDRLTVSFIPRNYTGTVETNLSLNYCGQEKDVDSFSFNVTENTTSEGEISSRTVSVTEKSAEVEIENGTVLVPDEQPSYWKTSSAEIINGSTEVQYDAPIFEKEETITYSVLQDGEVIGETTVKLEPEPTFWEKVQNRKTEIFRTALIASLIANLLLILNYLGVFQRLKSIEYQLPDIRNKED